MKMKTLWTIAAVALIGIGSLDLLFGNTNKPLLPNFIANHLTQQSDLVLIAGGGLLWWYL